MSTNDNVTSNRGQPRPRPNSAPAPQSPPRSSLPTETLSEQMIEVITEIRGFQREVGAWPVAISQRLAVLFREAKEQNAALQASEEAGWKKEQAAWQAERIELHRSLTDAAYKLTRLAVELEKRRDEQIWGWTRAEWAAFGMGVFLALMLGSCGAVIYAKFVQ